MVDINPEINGYELQALQVLQEAAEAFPVYMFKDINALASAANRVTVMHEDFQALRCLGFPI